VRFRQRSRRDVERSARQCVSAVKPRAAEIFTGNAPQVDPAIRNTALPDHNDHMTQQMQNPFEFGLSAPPGQATPITATWAEFSDFFKDYSDLHLGRHVYVHRFSNGVEVKSVVDLFPKRAFIRRESVTQAPPVTREQLLRFEKEFEASTDALFAAIAEKAGIDLATARIIYHASCGIVLFEPLNSNVGSSFTPALKGGL